MTASWERLCADGNEASGGYALLARKQAEFAAAQKGNLQKRQKKLQSQIDERLRSKIEQKKASHGIKTDLSAQDEGWGQTM